MSDKVSVIIPTYGRLNLLRRAIRSVLSQNYRNFEIIIVDDSPVDNYKLLINDFDDERLRYFNRGRKIGVASARNFGIKVSSGKLIAFLDDDDEWLPNKLKKQVALLQKSSNNIGIVHTNCYIDDGQKLLLFNRTPLSNQYLKELLKRNFIANSTCLVRRECFDDVGYFDEQILYAEDWEFFIRAARRYKFAYIHQPLAILHWENKNSIRLSNNLRKTVKGREYLVFKHWKEYERFPEILAQQLCIIGMKMDSLGDRKLAKWYLSKALIIFPACFPSVLYFFTQIMINQKIRSKIPIKVRILSKTFDESMLIK